MTLTYRYGDTLFKHQVDRNTGTGYYCLSYNTFKNYLTVYQDKKQMDEKALGNGQSEKLLRERYSFLSNRDCLIELPQGKKVPIAHAEFIFKSECIFARCDKIKLPHKEFLNSQLDNARHDYTTLKNHVRNELINLGTHAALSQTNAFSVLEKLEKITDSKEMTDYLTASIQKDLQLFKPQHFFASFMRFFRR